MNFVDPTPGIPRASRQTCASSVDLYPHDSRHGQRPPESSGRRSGLDPAVVDKPCGDDHPVRPNHHGRILAGVFPQRLVEALHRLRWRLPTRVSFIRTPLDPCSSEGPELVIERFTVPYDFVKPLVLHDPDVVVRSRAGQRCEGLYFLAREPDSVPGKLAPQCSCGHLPAP